MNWCVYLLLCANSALYAGISNRPQVRLAAHLAGKGGEIHPAAIVRRKCGLWRAV